MSDKNRSNAEMVGDFLREAGVLIVVFEALAKMVWQESETPNGILQIVVMFATGFGCFLLGMYIERRRRPE